MMYAPFPWCCGGAVFTDLGQADDCDGEYIPPDVMEDWMRKELKFLYEDNRTFVVVTLNDEQDVAKSVVKKIGFKEVGTWSRSRYKSDPLISLWYFSFDDCWDTFCKGDKPKKKKKKTVVNPF